MLLEKLLINIIGANKREKNSYSILLIKTKIMKRKSRYRRSKKRGLVRKYYVSRGGVRL